MAFSPHQLIAHERVAESKKNEGYFEALIDHYVPDAGIVEEEYAKRRLLYRLVNNDLEALKEVIRQYCDPTGAPEDFRLEDHSFLAFNEIHNKIRILQGEMLRRGGEYAVQLVSESDREQKATEFTDRLSAGVQGFIDAFGEAAGLEPAQREEAISEARKRAAEAYLEAVSHPSQWEALNERMLKMGYERENVIAKRLQSLHHQLVAGVQYVQVGRSYDRVSIDVLNSLHVGCEKSPNEHRVEKSDAVWVTDQLTPREALLLYRDELTSDQIHDLERGTSGGSAFTDYAQRGLDEIGGNGEFVYRTPHAKYTPDRGDRAEGIHRNRREGSNQFRGAMEGERENDDYVVRTRLEVKLLKKVKVLTRTYADGLAVVDFVPFDHPVPRKAKKSKVAIFGRKKITRYRWTEGEVEYACDELWVPRRYKVTRLDEDKIVDWGECEDQPDYTEHPFADFELSIKGLSEDAVNADLVSPVERAMPFLGQYLAIKNLMQREISKYVGSVTDVDFATVPDFVKDFRGVDEDDVSLDQVGGVLHMLRKAGINATDSTQLAGTDVRHTQSRGRTISGQQAAEILNLNRLAQSVREEIGMAMGISPQREAQMIESTASDNKEAQNASHFMTEPLFFANAEVWRSALEEFVHVSLRDLEKALVARDGAKTASLSFLASDGDEEVLRVTPDSFGAAPCAIRLVTGQDQRLYRESMLANLQAFSQNQGEGLKEISTVLRMISSKASPSEVHDAIDALDKERQRRMDERMKAEQEAGMKAEREAAQQAQAAEQRLMAHQERLAQIKRMGQVEAAAEMSSGTKYTADSRQETELQKIALGQNDQDGVNDQLEGLKIVEDIELARRREQREDAKEARASKEAEANVVATSAELKIKEKVADKPAAKPSRQ